MNDNVCVYIESDLKFVEILENVENNIQIKLNTHIYYIFVALTNFIFIIDQILFISCNLFVVNMAATKCITLVCY